MSFICVDTYHRSFHSFLTRSCLAYPCCALPFCCLDNHLNHIMPIRPAVSKTEKSQPQQPNIDDEDESLFKEVENDENIHDNQNIHINNNPSPLADPPSTQRKTLTPEFFLGSGSNNKNNTNLNKKERKRLDTSTTFNASLTTHTTSRSMRDTGINNHHYHMNTNQTNSPSIGMSKSRSTTSSSQEGHNMYAEIYIRTKPKSNKQPYSNNNPPPPSGISRDRSTMSSNTNPSLAMTAVSSLSGRSSMFGSTMMQHAAVASNMNQQENMPVTPEGHEMNYSLQESNGHGLHQSNNAAAVEEEYNYFDYDANIEAPLSPLGVSPKRQSESNVFGSNHYHSHYHGWSSRSSSRKGNTSSAAAIPIHHWKSKVNNLWSSVSKHTCRCFGEPFSNDESERDRVRGDGSKTAATSTTAANTSAAAAAAAVAKRKMNQTPMFSTPLKEPGLFD